jgi:hypothetical protein
VIRGYFSTAREQRRPFVHALLLFPSAGNRSLDVKMLVDTGADRTILAPVDARRLTARLGVDLSSLPRGGPSTAIGGRMETRTIEALIVLADFSTPLNLTILEPTPQPLPIPSLLGRDIISRFALVVEQRTNRVLLLDPQEADVLHLPEPRREPRVRRLSEVKGRNTSCTGHHAHASSSP